MSPIAAAFAGAGAVVLAVIGGYAGFVARQWAVRWYHLMQRLANSSESIQAELAYMRSLTGGVIGEQQVGGELSEAHVHRPQAVAPVNAQRAVVPFPAPFLDRFPQEPVPDATKDDTDIDLLSQTDLDLAALEKLEAMRQQGIEVEDSDTVHPGVVVDSK